MGSQIARVWNDSDCEERSLRVDWSVAFVAYPLIEGAFRVETYRWIIGWRSANTTVIHL